MMRVRWETLSLLFTSLVILTIVLTGVRKKDWSIPTPAVPVVTRFHFNVDEDNLDIDIESCKNTTEPTTDVR